MSPTVDVPATASYCYLKRIRVSDTHTCSFCSEVPDSATGEGGELLAVDYQKRKEKFEKFIWRKRTNAKKKNDNVEWYFFDEHHHSTQWFDDSIKFQKLVLAHTRNQFFLPGIVKNLESAQHCFGSRTKQTTEKENQTNHSRTTLTLGLSLGSRAVRYWFCNT